MFKGAVTAGLVLVGACAPAADGQGVVRVENADTACTLVVVVDGSTRFEVPPARTHEQTMDATGHELQFESTTDCFIYTNHPGSPFDSGRPICNVVVERNQTLRIPATGDNRGTHRELNVRCPE